MTEKMDSLLLQEEFFCRVNEVHGISHLFDFLPKIYLFVKNRQSQFIKANHAFLDLLGVANESDIIGRTDRDFFVADIADKYIEEDRQVMKTQKPFANRVWLVPNSNGLLVWYLCTKIPLFDRKGQVVGIAGTLCDYSVAGSVLEPYSEIAEVIKYINDHYRKNISIQFLADLAHLSLSQFERKFKKLFHTTPLKYITKVRLNAACQALTRSNDSITQIAHDTGFYDHSYFTKIFTKQIGIAPKEYRRQYYK